MNHRIPHLLLLIILLSIAQPIIANNNTKPLKAKPSIREYIWAITHPFIAIKVKRLTTLTLQTTDSIGNAGILKDISGGQLDAFKHAYWMALLSQNIKARKARRLGIIHEKINYRQFKRGNTGQDSTASLMDLKNNDIGIIIGITNRQLAVSELQIKVIKAIQNGELFIISKDKELNYIDCNGNIIDLTKEKDWNKRKCLVASNKKSS